MSIQYVQPSYRASWTEYQNDASRRRALRQSPRISDGQRHPVQVRKQNPTKPSTA